MLLSSESLFLEAASTPNHNCASCLCCVCCNMAIAITAYAAATCASCRYIDHALKKPTAFCRGAFFRPYCAFQLSDFAITRLIFSTLSRSGSQSTKLACTSTLFEKKTRPRHVKTLDRSLFFSVVFANVPAVIAEHCESSCDLPPGLDDSLNFVLAAQNEAQQKSRA